MKVFGKKISSKEEHLIDGELPFGWIGRNHAFVQQMTNENSKFLNRWVDSKNKSPKELYAALKSYVLYLNDCKKLCQSKGECYSKWFQDIIADDKYISQRKSELDDLEMNLDHLSASYTNRQSSLQGLDQHILEFIKQNDGILQKDLYKQFDESIKNEISEKLYFLEKLRKVQRIKQGNTYKLHIITDTLTH